MRLRLLKRGLLELVTGIPDEGYYTRTAPRPEPASSGDDTHNGNEESGNEC